MSWSRYMSTGSTAYDYTIYPELYNSPRSNEDTCPITNIAHAIDDVIMSVVPESEMFTNAAVQFDYVMTIVSSIWVFILLASIVIGAISNAIRQFNLMSLIKRVFTVIENEFLAPRSFLIVLALLTSTLLVGSIFPILSTKTPLLTYLLLSLAIFFFAMILLWPLSLIYNWGTYFTIYIKGEATMANLLGQVIMDYFYIISFFLRINLQFIRIVVLSGVFIMYNEFYFEFIYPIYNFEFSNFQATT